MHDAKTVVKRISIYKYLPSSSLTLLIILTHISGILGNSGHSIQISFKILITRLRTLTPVSCNS